MNNIYTIYCHRNKLNNKMYIGQTCQNPNRRWRNGNGYKHNPYFYNAIQKYGWDSFEHIILADNLTKEEANFYEQFYIVTYNTTDNCFGYNIDYGGKNNQHSKQTKEKIRQYNLGKHLSEETKQKISQKNKGTKHFLGKHHSEDTKHILSEINKGKNHPFYNKHHSEDTKKKMSEAHRGKPLTEEHKHKLSEVNKGKGTKKVGQYTQDGKLVKIYNSLKQTEEDGFNYTNISKCCRGKLNTSKGYIWKYID